MTHSRSSGSRTLWLPFGSSGHASRTFERFEPVTLRERSSASSLSPVCLPVHPLPSLLTIPPHLVTLAAPTSAPSRQHLLLSSPTTWIVQDLTRPTFFPVILSWGASAHPSLGDGHCRRRSPSLSIQLHRPIDHPGCQWAHLLRFYALAANVDCSCRSPQGTLNFPPPSLFDILLRPIALVNHPVKLSADPSPPFLCSGCRRLP